MKVEIERLVPSWNALLVKQDKTEEKVGSIYVPDKTREADRHAEVFGTVEKLGTLAFSFGTPGKDDFWRDPDAPRPGERIMYRKYAGAHFIEGTDGETYRLIDHTDVIGVLRQ